MNCWYKMNHNEKSVKWNYIYSLLYQLLAMIVPLVTTPYISRVLSADKIGMYSFTSSITSYFVLFGNLGTATYGQLCIATERNDKEKLSRDFWGIFLAKIVLMLGCTGLYGIYILADKQYTTMYVVLLLQILSSAVDVSWFLQGLEEFRIILIKNFIVKLISLVFVFLLVKDENDIYLYAAVMQGSVLLGNVSIYSSLKSYLVKVRIEDIRIFPHIKSSLKYFIPTIATSMYTVLDRCMIGWITHSESENGYYEQAHKIEQMAVTVVTSVSMVILPRMALLFKNEKVDEAKKYLRNSVKFVVWISIPMTTGLAGISANLIPWFLGYEYMQCVPLLMIFSLLIVIVGLNNAVGKQILMPSGRQKEYNMSVITGAMVNFAANLFLISMWEAIGAAVASVLAEAVVLLGFMHFCSDFIRWSDILCLCFKNIISGIIMGTLVFWSCKWIEPSLIGIAVQIALGIFFYCFVLLLLRDRFTIIQMYRCVAALRMRVSAFLKTK